VNGKIKKSSKYRKRKTNIKTIDIRSISKIYKCDNSLEEELNLNKTSRIISPELKGI
jgi:hypothetical protein